jgi:transglutaminase-like putative cysteine protease
VSLLKQLGFVARYVSGYLETFRQREKIQGSDASHAWVSVYVPEMGCVNLILQII